MLFKINNFYLILTVILNLNVVLSVRKYDKEDMKLLRNEVKKMFDHAYSGYIKYAYPYDELRPLSCDGVDTWGSYSLTLIDALDTLAVMGNYTEFRRVAEIVTAKANFDANINVSVFETNIRIVGGLLSSHLLSHKAGMELEPGWPCNGPLLRLAEDVAKRLLPAFDTKTGMPYGTVNLRHGVPPGETSVTCTAAVGTYIIEFGTLSRLTGDPVYEEVALNALESLFEYRSSIGLFGNHIDVETGRWTAQDSGIGAGVDSYFEYLVKGSILFGKPELKAMFDIARGPIEKYLNKNHWYVWASMSKGQVTLPVFQSLEAYWPGVLALIGDVENAVKTLANYRAVWKQLGFTPEFYNIGQGEAGQGRESYPLRPELAESAMLLYRVTKDPAILDIGKDILTSIQHSAKTKCGYATIKDTRDHTQEDRMESFFLSETTKYLYLLFDTDNFIHNDGLYGTVHTLPSGRECIIDSGPYIFNTEAHPIDSGSLDCCYDWTLETNGDSLSKPMYRGETIDFSNLDQKSSPPTSDTGETESKLESALKDIDDSLVNKDRKIDNRDENLAKLNTDLKQLNKDLDRILKIVLSQKNETLNNESLDDAKDQLNIDTLSKDEEPSFSKDSTPPPSSTHSEWDSDNQSANINESNMEDDKMNEGEDGGNIAADNEVTNLSQYIQELVSSRNTNEENFDPQILLDKIRNKKKKSKLNNVDFEVLTCPAQTVFTRISIATQLYN